MENNIVALKEKISALERKIAEDQEFINDRLKRIEELRKDLEKRDEKINRLENAIEELEYIVKDKDKAIAYRDEKIEELEKDLQEEVQETDEVKKDNNVVLIKLRDIFREIYSFLEDFDHLSVIKSPAIKKLEVADVMRRFGSLQDKTTKGLETIDWGYNKGW